jgi:hypothetical protein
MDDAGMHGWGSTADGANEGMSRRVFLSSVVVAGAAVGLAAVTDSALRPAAAQASTTPPTGPPTTTLPLPTTTAPEQLLLTWGRDPATDVTVSWSAPGTVPQPAPTFSYSAAPITARNPGRTISLPGPAPLDVTQPRPRASAISFSDGLNSQTTYFYHVELRDLEPGTRYYYEISDGATTPSTAGSSFQTAPRGRAPFRFSSFGDLATPSWDLNASGNIWHESCDNSYYAVSAIENPGDGNGPPLFHLLNGDLCYANLDYFNAPGVWRDFSINIARSAANRPWMPALGNHECEFGIDNLSGQPGTAAGGIGAQGAAGSYFNGPYGFGHYLSRFLLPDNGVTNYDGNRLRGNFYAFQVGTVQFISLDADDVIYQDGAANYVIDTANQPPEVTSSGASIPNGTTTYIHGYTGDLTIVTENNSAVPDFSSGTPNLQTLWLERTLREARQDPSVDMIVVYMHQVPLSTSSSGNGSDLGIRRAWLPLFDKYEVDLVLHGHEHDYERSYPVRGYDVGAFGTVVAANPGQTVGTKVDTRRPSVVTTTPTEVDGVPAWDTQQGTVFLVLGGGGTNGPTNEYGTDTADGLPQAKVITQRNAVVGSEATGFVKNGADSIEDAPWSAKTDPSDAYGYAIFDVDPGHGPGETTITFQYFAIPAVTDEATPQHDGTTTLPTTPFEKFVFGRGLGVKKHGPAAFATATA